MPFPSQVTFDPVTKAVLNWPGSVVREKVVGYTALDINGRMSSHSYKADRDTSDADILFGVAEIFDASAAAPKEIRITHTYRFTDPTILQALDDIQGSLNKVASLTFRAVTDGREEVFVVEVPALLARLKDPSGAFNPNAADASDLLDAIIDTLDEANSAVAYSNATVGTRTYQRGQRQARTPFIPQGQEDAGVDRDGT